MDTYTIYCTIAQIKKAFKLGAPIKLESEYYHPTEHDLKFDNPIPCESYTYGYHYAKCPTAEQMIGWLEDQLGENSSVYVVQDSQCWWSANVYDSCNYKIFHNNDYHSRKEATLAAIDAALEYLTQNKK